MKSRLNFYFRVFDTTAIPLPASAAPDPVTLFATPEASDPSVSTEGEIDLMDWLARQPDLLAVLLAQVCLSGRTVFDTNVVSPFYRNHKEGEIDLVAIPERAPQSAIAFQVKRFPVRRDGEDEWVALDRHKLAKLISQCNETAGLGFHKVYGVILLVADGRGHPAASTLHRGAGEQTFRRLYNFTRPDSLDPRVGLAFLEIVQPMARDWKTFGLVAAAIDKQADPIEQPGALSEKIEKWARRAMAKGRCAQIEFDCTRTYGLPVTAEDEVKAVLGPRSAGGS